MTGVLGCDDTGLDGGWFAELVGFLLIRRPGFVQHATDSGHTEVQSGPRQDLRDANLPHGRQEDLQLTDQVADEVGESVHGLRSMEQCAFAALIQPSQPGLHGLLIHQEEPCCLFACPTAGGL